MAKIRNFDSFGGCILRGEKPIFGPLSKNNTGMAALPAAPLTFTWPYLRCDVGLEEGEYK